MKNVAFIFPGQGAQFVGMGKEFYDFSLEAKEIFVQADEVVNGLTDVMFNGPQEKLTSTAFCQPAILTMSIAALKALQAHPQYEHLNPKFAAGLSLGEYTSLAAAESLSFKDTLELVAKRSACMEEATKQFPGKMTAVIGMEKEKILEICNQTGAEVANFNSPQQIVITGHAAKVEQAGKLIQEAGAKSVIPLDVSGAFHSSLMQPAADKFLPELKATTIQSAKIAIVHNVNGQSATDPETILTNLSQQITASVQWVATIEHMAANGVEYFIEIGPGKVLSGLIRRIDRQLNVYNIQTPADIENLPVFAAL